MPDNHLPYPAALVSAVILGRLRHKLSLRSLAEIFFERRLSCTHETVRGWAERFAPPVTAQLHAKRRDTAGMR